MAIAKAKNGVDLYFEEYGNGDTVVFAHEFAGDHRSWEPQVRHLQERYRCVVFSARGYPPSGVPVDGRAYSQEIARDDVIAVMDHLGIDRAHLVGLSMGSFACLHVALAAPARARSIVLAGCGWGSTPGDEESFRSDCAAAAQAFEVDVRVAAELHATGPARLQLKRKDERRWNEFRDRLAMHSPLGAANTLRGVQMRRPLLSALTPQMRALQVPTLVIAGDEDDRSLEPSLLLKRSILRAGLEVFPNSGHTLNVEEPERFNRALANFFSEVEAGTWPSRDARSSVPSFLAR